MKWTPARLDHLKQLFENGLSAAAIAAAMGGLTRNAVIGAVHRNGMTRPKPKPTRVKLISRTRIESPAKSLKGKSGFVETQALRTLVAPKVQAPPPPPIEDSKPVPFIERRSNQCAFPLWGNDQRIGDVCGAPKIDDPKVPYCHKHASVGWNGYGDR